MSISTHIRLVEPHPHMAELISSYQDGLTTPEEASMIERHMLECEICRAFYGGLQEARDTIADLAPDTNRHARLDAAWQEVARRIAKDGRKRRR